MAKTKKLDRDERQEIGIAITNKLIEFHDDWDEVSEIVGCDIPALYDKLSEMRDEV